MYIYMYLICDTQINYDNLSITDMICATETSTVLTLNMDLRFQLREDIFSHHFHQKSNA